MASQLGIFFSPFPDATINFQIIIFINQSFFASVFCVCDPNRSAGLGYFVLSRSFYEEFCQIFCQLLKIDSSNPACNFNTSFPFLTFTMDSVKIWQIFHLIQSWKVYLAQSEWGKDPQMIKKCKNISFFYLFYSSALLSQYKRDLISPLTLSNEDWNFINM